VTRVRKSALFRGGAAVMMLPLLGSCVAMAIPLLAAGGIASRQLRSRAEIVAALPAANAAALTADPDTRGTSVQLTNLTELPVPSGATSFVASPWQDFTRFALERARTLAQGDEAASALLTRDAVLNLQSRTSPCAVREAAVVIDLDPGTAVFVPGSAGHAAADVAAAAAQLREAGVIVLWVSQASANEVAGVAEALKASGLDPSGRDPILLVRNADERKQVLREEANRTVCVVAMAGDRRGDFDELFDYLRDQRLASVYDGQLGKGWFLVPELFEPAAAPQ
jgi:hypothetical protein